MQKSPERVPPQPLMVMIERLDGCWARYRVDLRRTRRDFASEYVHDLRVSIRRLIAAIEMGQALAHLKKFRKSKRLLRSQLEAFDALRDTQLQLTLVERLQEDLPEIVLFGDYLRGREKRLISRLNKRIKDFQSSALSRPVARLRKALLGKPVPEADAAIWAEVDQAFAVVIRRRSAVRAGDTATIHRLRLAFKDFRYRIESIQPLLVKGPARSCTGCAIIKH